MEIFRRELFRILRSGGNREMVDGIRWIWDGVEGEIFMLWEDFLCGEGKVVNQIEIGSA
jgi:hypothetical protein